MFIQNWNEALEKKDGSTLGMMSAVQLAKLNLCLKKLEGTGIDLETCVDFYLKHNTSVNAQTKLLEAVISPPPLKPSPAVSVTPL